MLSLKTFSLLLVAVCIAESHQSNLLRNQLEGTKSFPAPTTSTSTTTSQPTLTLDENKANNAKMNVTSRQFIPGGPVFSVVPDMVSIKPFLIQQPVMSYTGEIILENTIGGLN